MKPYIIKSFSSSQRAEGLGYRVSTDNHLGKDSHSKEACDIVPFIEVFRSFMGYEVLGRVSVD